MALLASTRRLTEELKNHIGTLRFDLSASPPSDTSWPRVTVITPSFNQGRYLERTIISIHNQGYPNLEHIIIDGGSTDESVQIIRKYEKRFAYWRSRTDMGQSDAINIGASKATGRYIMWINSDDLLMPGALRTLIGTMKDDPAVDLVYGNQVEVDEADRVIKRLFTIDFDIRDFLYEINIIVHQQSAIWTAELFHRVGGLKMFRYAMDYDLVYRMYASGARFRRIPGFLSAFRVHSQGLTGSGEVARHRDSEVDGSFRSHMGRDRNLWDRTAMKYIFKARRFMREPKALIAAAEHRIGRLVSRS